jgi:hypothetical protein
VLVYIPSGYQSLEIFSSTSFSKHAKVFSKYVFVGVPDSTRGLLIVGLDRSQALDAQLASLKDTLKKNLESDFYDRLEVELRNAEVMRQNKRLQVFIASPLQNGATQAQQGTPADPPASAPLRQEGG